MNELHTFVMPTVTTAKVSNNYDIGVGNYIANRDALLRKMAGFEQTSDTTVKRDTTVKMETPKEFEKTLFTPKRIVKNGIATIVFWQDGTKTIVKRAPDEPESDYAAFVSALGIKCFGSNSALKRIVERTETQKPKKQKQKKRSVDLFWDGYPNQR